MDRAIIFTCAGGLYIEKLISILKNKNPHRKIYGMDANSEIKINESMYTDFFNILTPDKENYFVDIFNKIKNLGPSILIPGADEEVFALSDHFTKMKEHNILCNVMKKEDINIIRDKYLLNKRIKKHAGSYCVECIGVNNFYEFKEVCYQLGYPEKKIVLKPKIGRGRRNTFIINSRNIDEKISDAVPNVSLDIIKNKNIFEQDSMMAMEYIEGKSLTIDVLADRGKIIQYVVREWNKNWRFPFPGQKIINDIEVFDMVNKLSTICNLHGLTDIDAIKTAEGKIVLLEINPRPSGSIVVTEKAGISIFNMLEKILEGNSVDTFNLSKSLEIKNL